MSCARANLLLALASPALRTTLDSARLITARNAGSLRLLCLLEVVLRDPLLLVATCASRGDGADGCTDLHGGLALLGLRREGRVERVASTTDNGENDEVSCQAEMCVGVR